jgi:co-chaperonin GroES (HSP10)
MATPKSKKLQKEEADEAAKPSNRGGSLAIAEPEPLEGPIQVRRVDCCNDFVAVLQSQIHTTIDLVNDDSKFKNEGLVIGVGPGVADGNGGRLKPCVAVGDYIIFCARNVVQRIESNSPPYQGQTVVIISEKNVICKLPTSPDWVEFEGD